VLLFVELMAQLFGRIFLRILFVLVSVFLSYFKAIMNQIRLRLKARLSWGTSQHFSKYPSWILGVLLLREEKTEKRVGKGKEEKG